MEEVFKKVNLLEFKIHLMDNKGHHAAVVSKKSTSKREYTVIIPKTDIIGSRFGKCTCGYPRKEGIPCDHMVAVFKLGRINQLSRIAVMSHWYMTEQWHNRFPENTYIDTHKILKLIVTVQPEWDPRRRVIQRRKCAGRVLLTISSNQQRRSGGQLKPPKHQRRREWIW